MLNVDFIALTMMGHIQQVSKWNVDEAEVSIVVNTFMTHF
jgi:hypothetical protein